MTLILALDSATDACSVALYREGEVTSRFELAAKSHTQRLLPMVDELLVQSGCTINDVSAIAFGRGPGSFTGLRICMGVVQGLAFGASLPVIPVSTLAAVALAYQREYPQHNDPCLVALDARMGEVYWAIYGRPAQGLTPQLLNEEQVMSPTRVAQDPQVLALDGRFAALGQGWQYQELEAICPAHCQQDVYPHAEAIALIGAQAWAEGNTSRVMDVEPVYLRNDVSWQKRQRIRTQENLP